MEADPLQQLRDVHMPMEPSWFPPAPGWWLLAILILLAVAWGALHLLRWWQRRRPVRQARALHAELCEALNSGRIDPQTYLHQCNALLKRLLVVALGHQEYARQAGDDWLLSLDVLSDSTEFSNGPGRVLGDERFREDPQFDPQRFTAVMQQTLARITP